MDPHWPPRYPDNLPYTNKSIQSKQPIAQGGNEHLQQQLRNFWAVQQLESEHEVDFRNHSLPLARIKKIMKSEEDVRMVSAEAPVFLARACEMFILDLTLRSWSCTEDSRRRTLQKSDIASALSTSDLFDFLVDIVPREKHPMQQQQQGMTSSLMSSVTWQQQQQGYNSVDDGAGLLAVGVEPQMPLMPGHHHDQNESGFNNAQGSWATLFDDHQPHTQGPHLPDF